MAPLLQRLLTLYSLCLTVAFCNAYPDEEDRKNKPKKIAVIGGAVTGSFVTKYLVDYDQSCEKLDSITVFEPNPVTGPIKPTDDESSNQELQGSRVASLQLQDGTIIELGASIGYKGFYHVIEMIKQDESLEMTKPFSTGIDEPDDVEETTREGMGIYAGNGQWPLITAGVSDSKKKSQMTMRYNWDLYKVTRMCHHFLSQWATLPSLLDSLEADTFYQSPDEIWHSIGLLNAALSSFDELLDAIGVSKHELSWWRKYLPYQGSIRSEFLTAINLVNYNQNTSRVNGIVGLGSFAAALGGLFSVKGGNYKIIQSAYNQAVQNRKTTCNRPEDTTIQQVTTRVTTVLGELEGFTLYSGEKLIGEYDIVVLAAPLQQSQINFVVRSHWDAAVIQPMPLGGLIDAHEEAVDKDGGKPPLPVPLPLSAKRPYTQVVTTVVSNGNLTADAIAWPETSPVMPKSVLVTNEGKAALHNITAITFVKEGVYKLFSDNPLPESLLKSLFGPGHKVEISKVWGGPHGGATPDYQGEGIATSFMLYDAATNLEGHTNSGALYYPSAMEQSSLASMEISAVGAKAVAKLIAKRLGMITPQAKETHDEL